MSLLSRRTFLRGAVAGATVSLALPPLEAMLTDRGAYADSPGDEPWFGLFFWANGLPWHAGHGLAQAGHPDLWTPATTGSIDWGSAPELLAPLAPHDVSVVTGLEPKTVEPALPPGQGDGHMKGFMVAMTGDRVRTAGFDHASHTLSARRATIDQYVARHDRFYSAAPRFRSLHVGISEARFHGYGHWNAISYNAGDSTNPPISRPTELFDLLFSVPGDVAELAGRASALDAVLEDANRLRARLGHSDRARLDAHLESVHAVQRRLELSAATCEAPARPSDEGDLMTRTETMADLLAIALSCGLTRVFSFMLTSPATTHVFSNLGVVSGMHKTCHDGIWEDVRRITRYQMECFAALLERLAQVSLPMGGTLLDAGMVLGTSEYGEGYKHGNREHPFVLAGSAKGAIRAGQHVRIDGGNLARAQLTAINALGLGEPSFGFSGAETSDEISELRGGA